MNLTGRIQRTYSTSGAFARATPLQTNISGPRMPVLGAMLRHAARRAPLQVGCGRLPLGGRKKFAYVYRGSPIDTGYSSVEYDDGTVEEIPDEEVSNTYELALPFEFGVGASAEVLPGLTLAGSLHLAEWSQSEYKGADEHGFARSYLVLRLSTETSCATTSVPSTRCRSLRWI